MIRGVHSHIGQLSTTERLIALGEALRKLQIAVDSAPIGIERDSYLSLRPTEIAALIWRIDETGKQ